MDAYSTMVHNPEAAKRELKVSTRASGYDPRKKELTKDPPPPALPSVYPLTLIPTYGGTIPTCMRVHETSIAHRMENSRLRNTRSR